MAATGSVIALIHFPTWGNARGPLPDAVRSFIRSYLRVPKFGLEIRAFAFVTEFPFGPVCPPFNTFIRQRQTDGQTERQTSLPMSSRMTCTSLERLALLPPVPPRRARPQPAPVALLGRTPPRRRSPVVPRKLHIISTPAISRPPSSLPPSFPLSPSAMCAVKLVRQPLFYWRRRTDRRGKAEWLNKCRLPTRHRHRESELCRLLRLRCLFFFVLASYSSSLFCEDLILFSYDDLLHGGGTRTQWETSGA